MVYAKSDWHQHRIDLASYCDEKQEVVAVSTTVRQTNHIFVSIDYRPFKGNIKTRNQDGLRTCTISTRENRNTTEETSTSNTQREVTHVLHQAQKI